MKEADYAQRIERAFVEIIIERSERKGFKKGEFASKVWPDMTSKAAATRWNSIRIKASNTGKPQSVPIADAQRMADVLGENLSYLLAVAMEKARKY